MIGSQALVDHVAAAGLRIVNHTEFATRADVVVVADHERFDYAELRTATQAVLRGADADRPHARPRPSRCPTARGRPAAPLLAAVEAAAGRTADEVVGKPEPGMYDTARDRLGEGRALAVGDRLDVDVAGGAAGRAGHRARAHRARRRPRTPPRPGGTAAARRSSPTRSRRWS